VRLTLTVLRRTPKLLECHPITLAGAIIQACQLGLEPDGVLGEYWLTPRRIHGEWQVVGITGYRGLMKLARQSGDMDWIFPSVAYASDAFEYEEGDHPFVKHKPGPGPRDPVRITHAYAVVCFKSGSRLPRVLPRWDIDVVRDRYAAAKDDGPWVTHYGDMAMKTAIRRLCKYLSQSPMLGLAVALDEQAEAGLPQGFDSLVDAHEIGLGSRSTLGKLTDALEESNLQANGAVAAESVGSADQGDPPRAAAPESPPPAAPAAAPAALPRPTPRRSKGKFPRADEVERPKSSADTPTFQEPAEMSAPSWTQEEEPAQPAPASNAWPPVTATNAFDLLAAAGTEEQLDGIDEHVQSSDVFKAWDSAQQVTWRGGVRVRRKRLQEAHG